LNETLAKPGALQMQIAMDEANRSGRFSQAFQGEKKRNHLMGCA
jgi:hypothetical protein